MINKTTTYRPSANNFQKPNCGGSGEEVITGVWIMNKSMEQRGTEGSMSIRNIKHWSRVRDNKSEYQV